ncbi:cell division ATP-binding protein FtsE [Schumannella sp. 10F1B-5-1]|uniref:cell division ATP-binding protein FtsE n=1 Tax=Schumannella sp. 10F1B-5-1 TaxID=2590780 RepID=UPI0011318281|nr:cell division ATP-binding protein FtsE [Schumannella sp. 10F1B-5-1]TPW73359.1 cell division ATP-binding protein FtsE [Schumannella sp. 10F1B-5-1]
MIRFDAVTKTYRGQKRPALDDVNLEILKGEFVFLVGASGSGKSSFLRLVLKEERASKGRVHVLGQTLNTLSNRKVPYFRRNLGVVFQDFRLLHNKTVFDNVAFTLQVIGKSKGFIQEAVPDVLKLVGLAGKQNRMPHELSGGEQQRVAIARAVVNKPAILLADEPTGNLDPATSAGIMALLSAINANGTTVLMATHDAGIVDQMQRRVIELVAGRIVRDEREGGYQTQAVPIQALENDQELYELAMTGALPTLSVEADPAVDAAPAAPRPVAVTEAPDIETPSSAPAPAAAQAQTQPQFAPRPAAATRQAAPAAAQQQPAAAAPQQAAEQPAPRRDGAPMTAAEALAEAVSRATSTLPIQRGSSGERPELREPEEGR